MIWIDGNVFSYGFEGKNIKLLTKNDGFESVESFFEYFNENFRGKIIHWTEFTY